MTPAPPQQTSLPRRTFALAHRLLPRTLLVRTFALLGLLLVGSVCIWLILFGLAEREPRARQLAQLTVSIVNTTSAALIAAAPDKRAQLLIDLAESEGLSLHPASPSDRIAPLPDTHFFRLVLAAAREELDEETRFAGAINGEQGIWVGFSLDEEGLENYWLMIPGEHAESDLPLRLLSWGGASLALALIVAWLIVSRVTLPLRTLAKAVATLGRGHYPPPVPERGVLELRQLAAAFNRMSADLKRMDGERAEILAGISHDLRTPLARLRLEAELSIHDEAARQAVADDIDRLDAIIGQFLNFARGSADETPVTTDLDALVGQLIEAYARSEQAISFTPGGTPLPLRRQGVQRALGNLIDNAGKYGGGPIEVTTWHDDDDAGIDVLDRGPGIPPGEIERLKQPFTRLQSARSNACGTGLGLAIAERMARLHGGRLELLPRPGGGLIARLRFARQNAG